jgi:hypothetical protein
MSTPSPKDFTITDMRTHLMETLAALRNREQPMEVDRARAIAQVAGVLVESARVEVQYIQATHSTVESPFIAPLNPSPDAAIARDQREGLGSAIQRTAHGLVHRTPG